jgi:hypothetical protein
MCDYSLHSIESRLAVERERLVIHRFHTGSIGLAPAAAISATDSHKTYSGFWKRLFAWDTKPEPCAVCIPPGAKLVLSDIPAYLRTKVGVRETEEVIFTQVTAQEMTHRDAVRFANGATVLLQCFEPGQRAEVLTLSGTEEPAFNEIIA